MNVSGEKFHVSSPTWNFCIHFKGAESTLIKRSHFTYERGICVLINSTFTLLRLILGVKFHVHTRTSEGHRPEKILSFSGSYCIYITIFIFYDVIIVIYIKIMWRKGEKSKI